ncbi:MAG: hypothetical protein WED07_03560 [Candidatus Freyarchaeum deiterrae]
MPIVKKDLLFLSQIPFQLSCEKYLSPSRWCFYLSFNWGIHKELPPSTAQKILTLALEEKILEKQNETLTLKEKSNFPPLYKFDKKIGNEELANVKPYPIRSKIEYNEVELQIQEKPIKKEKEPLIEHLKTKKPSRIPKEVKEEKPRKEKQIETKPKKEAKEEKPKPKTKTAKKQKTKENKPELTLDHFTKT